MKMKTIKILFYFIVLSILTISSSIKAEDITFETKSEISKLLEFVENSTCKFNRNGSWYSSTDAAKHIKKKYQYVLKKGYVKSTEDFIKYAATKSSISGKGYFVQCKDGSLSSALWLQTELENIRK
jgi:hypothetical protein